MAMQCHEVQIEDLRHHPIESIKALRRTLCDGAKVKRDPKRDGFYEIDDGRSVYYIHVTPMGKVLLLATWPSEAALETANRAA
jgi:hypothetical protein